MRPPHTAPTGDLWSSLAARHGLPRGVVKSTCHMFLYMNNLTFEEAVECCEVRCQGLKLGAMLRDFKKRAEMLPSGSKTEKNDSET